MGYINNSEVQDIESSFGRRQRMKKPSSKGRKHKLSQIKDKRQRPYSRLLRKSGAIEEPFYSSKNKIAVEVELAQFNDILKLYTRNRSNIWKKSKSTKVMNDLMK